MTPDKPSLFQRFFGGGATVLDRRKKARSAPAPDSKILIIDDSRTIVAVLGKMLRQGGYQAISALDAESGIALALSEKPRLIFLDIVLPGMNGFAALRVLRREPITQRTPIIMMSGNMQATEQFYAQKHGADDFLKKPFPRAELFHRIEALLGPGPWPRTQPEHGDADSSTQIVGTPPSPEQA